MDCQVESNTSRRRSLRRAVRLEADVASDLWDGSVPLLATNVSMHGLWLESELPLDAGAQLLVSLVPPRWQGAEPFVALAEVARVGLFRRQREQRSSGMGLTFIDFERLHEQQLREALRGLPPPLPVRNTVRPPPLPQRVVLGQGVVLAPSHPSVEEIGRLPQLTLDNGQTFTLRAEAELLTAGRGIALAARGLVSTEPPVARVLRLSSPMTAILDRAEPRALRAIG